MIQAKELRIGNFVNAKVGTTKNPKRANVSINGIYTSTPFPSINAYVINYGRTIDLRDIEPIPLTEQWLSDFGFKNSLGINNHTNGFWSKDGLGIEIGYFIQDKFYEFEFNGIITELKHVHQLQNLYYALTGTELTLTPPKTKDK